MKRRTTGARRKADETPRWTRARVVSVLAGAAVVLSVVAAAAAWHHRETLPAWPEQGIAPVQRVLVEGPFERVSPLDVEEAVLPHLRGGFFTVDLGAIRDAAESLAWVDRAQVVREWPDRVRIVVTEQRPAWRWGDDALLNERGERFVSGVTERPEALPRLDGPDGYERQLVQRFVEVDAALAPCAMRVRSLELDARRSLRVGLDGGIAVRFGREAVEQRVQRFCDVVVGAIAPRLDRVAYVDMRYTNGFAVGWRTREGAS